MAVSGSTPCSAPPHTMLKVPLQGNLSKEGTGRVRGVSGAEWGRMRTQLPHHQLGDSEAAQHERAQPNVLSQEPGVVPIKKKKKIQV